MEDVQMVLNSPVVLTENNMIIYPNPFSESTTITFSNMISDINKYNLKIIDITGKTVRTITNSSCHSERSEESIIIERGNLKAGIYFVELNADKVYRGKLVVE